jgi:hypothetical protein
LGREQTCKGESLACGGDQGAEVGVGEGSPDIGVEVDECPERAYFAHISKIYQRHYICCIINYPNFMSSIFSDVTQDGMAEHY